MATHGAVAVIETPKSFVLEGRPNWPGKLAFAGMTGLFGGHVEPGEDASTAVVRELGQELCLEVQDEPTRLWEGDVIGEDKTGQAITLKVSLFHVAVDSVTELDMQVHGEIVEIPKTLDGIDAHKDTLVPFARLALQGLVTGVELNQTHLKPVLALAS